MPSWGAISISGGPETVLERGAGRDEGSGGLRKLIVGRGLSKAEEAEEAAGADGLCPPVTSEEWGRKGAGYEGGASGGQPQQPMWLVSLRGTGLFLDWTG
jgi:hypothetical protein